MPNLENSIPHSDALTLPTKSMQKTPIKQGNPNMIDMSDAAKGCTTTSTTNSSHTMGLDRKSKQISKRGKKTVQKVSIVLIFISVISLFWFIILDKEH